MKKVVVKRTNDKRPFFDRHKDHPGGSIRIETDEPVEVALTPHIANALRRGRLEQVVEQVVDEVLPEPTPEPAEPGGGAPLPSAPRRRKKPDMGDDAGDQLLIGEEA